MAAISVRAMRRLTTSAGCGCSSLRSMVGVDMTRLPSRIGERQVIEREARAGRLGDLGVARARLGRCHRPRGGAVALGAAAEPAREGAREHLVAGKSAVERDVHHAVGAGRPAARRPGPAAAAACRLSAFRRPAGGTPGAGETTTIPTRAASASSDTSPSRRPLTWRSRLSRSARLGIDRRNDRQSRPPVS